MKKLIATVALVAIMLSVVACADITPTSENFVPTEAMEVVVAYMNSKAKVVTRKTTEKPLSGIKIACVYYDADGAQIGQVKLIDGVIMAEETVSVWTFDAPEGCVYVDAEIVGATYEDGTEEKCPGVDAWVKETVAAFDPEARQTFLRAQGEKAEQCPVITLTPEFTVDNGLQTTVANMSDNAIDQVILYNLWYDEAGLPVDVGGQFAINATRARLSDLAAKESAEFTIPTEEGTAKAKQVVEAVYFSDGTSWQNENVHYWIAANLGVAE